MLFRSYVLAFQVCTSFLIYLFLIYLKIWDLISFVMYLFLIYLKRWNLINEWNSFYGWKWARAGPRPIGLGRLRVRLLVQSEIIQVGLGPKYRAHFFSGRTQAYLWPKPGPSLNFNPNKRWREAVRPKPKMAPADRCSGRSKINLTQTI